MRYSNYAANKIRSEESNPKSYKFVPDWVRNQGYEFTEDWKAKRDASPILSRKKANKLKKKIKQKPRLKNEFNGAYKEYIRSKVWKGRREEILKRDNLKCVICKKKAIQVHHWFYTYPFGIERGYQLSSVCLRCHTFIHTEYKDTVGRLCAEDKNSVRREIYDLIIDISKDVALIDWNEELTGNK